MEAGYDGARGSTVIDFGQWLLGYSGGLSVEETAEILAYPRLRCYAAGRWPTHGCAGKA